VIVGAYLTQNTAWTNVEKALANLRSAKLLSVKGIFGECLWENWSADSALGVLSSEGQAAENLHRVSGSTYEGSLRRLFSRPTAELREELLS
jgi:endonuclease-3 related protein